MHIFVDQCVHTDVIESLKKAGFKVERAADKGLAKAGDEEIFNYILKAKCVLLTYDTDFGNIIRFSITSAKGVVIVYVEGMERDEIIQKVVSFFKNSPEKELAGSLFIIDASRIRIWRHR